MFDPDRHHRRSIRLPGYDYSQHGTYFVTLCTHERLCLFGEVVDGQMRLSPLGRVVYEEWYRSAQIRREIVLYPDELVIMPNHLHGIVWIVETSDVGAHGLGAHGLGAHGLGAHCRAPLRGDENPIVGVDGCPPHPCPPFHTPGEIPIVGADGCPPNKMSSTNVRAHDMGAHRRAPLRGGGDDITRAHGLGAHNRAPLQRRPRSLSSFIAGFKSATTARVNTMRGTPGEPLWQRNYYEHIIRDEACLNRIREYILLNPLRWHLDHENTERDGEDELWNALW